MGQRSSSPHPPPASGFSFFSSRLASGLVRMQPTRGLLFCVYSSPGNPVRGWKVSFCFVLFSSAVELMGDISLLHRDGQYSYQISSSSVLNQHLRFGQSAYLTGTLPREY